MRKNEIFMRFYEKVMRFYEIETCYNAGKSRELTKSLRVFHIPPEGSRENACARTSAEKGIYKLFRFLKHFAFLGKFLQKYGRSADLSREIRRVLPVSRVAAAA